MIFEDLNKNSVKDMEKEVSKYWEDIDILKRSIETREGCENFVFYEGPPTANGKPGIHHVIARTLKDSVCKFKNMQGYRVKRKAGWDTHGLPVEIEVEKTLNMNGKGDIEKYGIAEFNKKCRESVFTYEALWRDMTKRMGYFIDLDNPYITLDNNYIESVWWILKEFFDAGLIYEGHKILPYCPRCGTGLASHEVAQGYQNIKTNSVYVAFKIKGKDEYFLVWTTTPWTLPSNVALCVGEDIDYIKVKSKGETFILAKALVNTVIGDDYEIIEEMKGKDLEGIEYEQLLDFVKVPQGKKAHYVVLGDFVSTEDGTGIVHIAPAFGEDDYNVSRKYGLPVLNPVGEDGAFLETPWKGTFVIDADLDIIKYLKEHDMLFKKQKIEHNYPHCWRCKTPLLYYGKPSWYIEMTKLREDLVAANDTVKWYPDFVGEKRFGNWIENVKDWAISRSRYWGTPLNIWRCECGHLHSVGSRKQLAMDAIEDIDETIELHRPYVDEIHIKCPECGKSMTRVKDVIDCWFDSGSMPFAQQHYPFENKEEFEEQFPANFICEGIDQTRGWFYSLLAISTFIMKKAPYKSVLVNDLILDANGQKMSKSKGNTVDPFELFDKYGADALRWYLLYVSPAWTPTKFDEEGLKEVISKFFNTLKNVYTFFVMYANTDDVDPKEFFVEYKDRDEIDLWILSKYNNLVKAVTADMEINEHTKAVKKIQDFVNEDLSNWYIRRCRRRFWASELDNDKKAVYNTTYEVLVGLCKLIAPFAPFISEEIFRKLTGKESVHIERYPEANEDLIDEKTEFKMDLVRTLVSLGRSAREEANIKVRQPVKDILVYGADKNIIGNLIDLIKEELNVKIVTFPDNLEEYMNFILKLDFKVAGKILGKDVKRAVAALNICDAKKTIDELEKNGEVTLDTPEGPLTLKQEWVEVRTDAKEGFNVQKEDDLFVILDTNLDEDLIKEGYVREVISKVQQMRKNNDYEVTDRIDITIDCDDVIKSSIEEFEAYLKKETLCDNIIYSDNDGSNVKLNDKEAIITLKRK
ncbi:isoleucine--tRNA ligase [Anaerofustis stercorihominis]|uniref:Isoleucine--tRNA ligase n=1 Tax=Anaerofustis stercorihominis TaxID=214853 RepID=A0A3E3E1B0_9FIRM|nr:isoleucine--tRNA ligase [Anaerofustis stercorihominis]RGD75263.1 isoleucine--tRNA ligase [Anaerofustis stercorihominis]